MKISNQVTIALGTAAAISTWSSASAYVVPRRTTRSPLIFRQAETTSERSTASPSSTSASAGSSDGKTVMQMTTEDGPAPSTFREAEILGLRLMQEGNFEKALTAFQKGMKLPGSRQDVIRKKSLAGPSPVGGSFGGTESDRVQMLDEFELQAAHYNMACAHARLGNLNDSIVNLKKAFDCGFDNYSTVRGDPDLDPIKQETDFLKLMEAVEPNKGFNPFGLFKK